jgi:hypothetical protein
VLLHDDAHPHAVMLSHITTSPHGPDLAQSRIHLFALLKGAVQGFCFDSDYKLKYAHVACHLIRNMFSNGIHKVMQCWTKCTEQHGGGL